MSSRWNINIRPEVDAIHVDCEGAETVKKLWVLSYLWDQKHGRSLWTALKTLLDELVSHILSSSRSISLLPVWV